MSDHCNSPDSEADPYSDPFASIYANAAGRPYFKPDPEAMKKLNPKVFPELTPHYRYKYTNKRKGIYILASHIRNNDDTTSHVEWSLYLDNKNENDDNEPLIELNNTTDEDFRNIVDAEDWESEDIGLVIVK